MSKKPMTSAQKRFVKLSVSMGCIICNRPAQWHHVRGARQDNSHTQGFPLCPEEHTGMEYPGQSIHGNHLLFTQKHGTELQLVEKNLLRVLAELEKSTIPF